MYTIIRRTNGEFECVCRIQDGEERWSMPTEKKAIASLIQSAYVLNGTRINHENIKFVDEERQPRFQNFITKDEEQLLADIRSGQKKVLPWDDFRLKANLLPKEVQMLIDIREGRLDTVPVLS